MVTANPFVLLSNLFMACLGKEGWLHLGLGLALRETNFSGIFLIWEGNALTAASLFIQIEI